MVVNPFLVLSWFIGARGKRGLNFVASVSRYLYSVLSLPFGANRTPRVCLPVVTSTWLIDFVQSLVLPCVR
jgi:hypothetical protein